MLLVLSGFEVCVRTEGQKLCIDSTKIYTRIDKERLRQIAEKVSRVKVK